MGKKKHSKKPLEFHEILQILAQEAGTRRGMGGYSKAKGKGKGKGKRPLINAPIPNYDPYFDEPEIGSFKNSGRSKKKKAPFSNKKGPAKESGVPKISFIPSSSKNLQEEIKIKGFKLGGDKKEATPIMPRDAAIKYCYDSNIKPVDTDMNPGCSENHAIMIDSKDSSESESGEISDIIAAREEASDGSNEPMDGCEDFHIDTVGDPSQKSLPAQARQPEEDEVISFRGLGDVNSVQAQKSHHKEAMQDYLDNISVEDLDMKLNEVHLSQDSDSDGSMSYGSLDGSDITSFLGSEPSEEWAEGFREGLECALDLLPKFARKILTNELKASVHKSLLPPSIAPKSLAKKTPQGLDKKPNEDRRHSTTVKGSSLQAANEAILDMLNNPHRKQIQFPLVSKPHRSSIIALAELYNLDVITPQIKKNPLRVLKPDSTYALPSAAEVNALIGYLPDSPVPKHSPHKKAKTGIVVCSSVPPIASSNIGHRLLAQMGWSPGQALGAAGDGILAPIQAEIRKKRQGLGS